VKILIFGVGPLGSLFAARLHEAGHDVSVLARGQRLQDLREHGIVLEYADTGAHEVTRVNVVESLEPEDAYDLILVVMRKNQALEILPTLAANRNTLTILFMMNNAAGQDALIQVLGKERVMIGFPLPGGHRIDHVMRVWPADDRRQYTLPIGEVDGSVTARTRQVADVLESMRGYNVEIRTDMDAWLKYHVAVVMPMAAALYGAGLDAARLARTRDALVLVVRGMREAIAALQQANVPVSPGLLRLFMWMTEPVLVWLLARLMSHPIMEVSGVGHARAARDEMQHLSDEFLTFVRQAGAETPVLDQLYGYTAGATPPMPDGSRELPLHWRNFWMVTGAKLSFVALLIYLAARKRQKPAATVSQEQAQLEHAGSIH
jgi:2-dehydropantoate 2-reductase